MRKVPVSGAYTKYADTLNVTLDALVRRNLVETKPNNSFSFRTYLNPLQTKQFPLETPDKELDNSQQMRRRYLQNAVR